MYKKKKKERNTRDRQVTPSLKTSSKSVLLRFLKKRVCCLTSEKNLSWKEASPTVQKKIHKSQIHRSYKSFLIFVVYLLELTLMQFYILNDYVSFTVKPHIEHNTLHSMNSYCNRTNAFPNTKMSYSMQL